MCCPMSIHTSVRPAFSSFVVECKNFPIQFMIAKVSVIPICYWAAFFSMYTASLGLVALIPCIHFAIEEYLVTSKLAFTFVQF